MGLMSSFKTPCGMKSYYPEILDYYTRQGKACVFHTYSNKSFKAYLAMPKKKGVDFIAEGTAEEIVLLYEKLKLTEHKVADPSGVFFFKLANSEDELSDELEKFIANEM